MNFSSKFWSSWCDSLSSQYPIRYQFYHCPSRKPFGTFQVFLKCISNTKEAQKYWPNRVWDYHKIWAWTRNASSSLFLSLCQGSLVSYCFPSPHLLRHPLVLDILLSDRHHQLHQRSSYHLWFWQRTELLWPLCRKSAQTLEIEGTQRLPKQFQEHLQYLRINPRLNIFSLCVGRLLTSKPSESMCKQGVPPLWPCSFWLPFRDHKSLLHDLVDLTRAHRPLSPMSSFSNTSHRCLLC